MPEITVFCGAFSAAIATSAAAALIDHSATAASSAKMAAMAPSRGRACMRRARVDEQLKDLLQRVDACAISGRKLANAVSQDSVGNDAP